MRCGGGLRLQSSNPMLLEDVAIAFPDMQIIVAHPSWPWQDEAISLAMHKPNIWIDLSGWSPKYFPPQLVQYSNTLLEGPHPLRQRLPADHAGPLAEGLRGGWLQGRGQAADPQAQRDAPAEARCAREHCRTRRGISLIDTLLNHPAVQAGVAPFVVALMVAASLQRSRLLGLAIGAALVTVIALTIGFSFESLTSMRKMVLAGLIASALVLPLELTSTGPGPRVRWTVAVAAGLAGVWWCCACCSSRGSGSHRSVAWRPPPS